MPYVPSLESMPKPKQMRLVDVPAVTELPFKRVSSIFEPFLDFGEDSTGNKKKDQLAKLYQPPRDLFSANTYEEVSSGSIV